MPGSKLSVMSRKENNLRIHGRQKAVNTDVAAFNPGVLLKISMQSPKEKAHNINPLRLLSESIFNKSRYRTTVWHIVQNECG